MSSLMVSAQQDWTEARKEIHQNIRLSASNFLAYVDPTDALTPAPKGYEAFYLTHYGRHGSRWLIGEWEYTDAMKVLAQQGQMNAVDFIGKRYDMGNKLGVLMANVEQGVKHPEVGEKFKEYLKDFVKTL